MKKFLFKFEKILRLKKFREEECKLELAQAISILNVIENKIKQTALKRHQAALNRFSDANNIASYELYILRLDREAINLTEQAAKAEIIVEEKRNLYMEAQKDLKAMEKLKEKQQIEYRKEMMNYEMNEIDNLTAVRYISGND